MQNYGKFLTPFTEDVFLIHVLISPDNIFLISARVNGLLNPRLLLSSQYFSFGFHSGLKKLFSCGVLQKGQKTLRLLGCFQVFTGNLLPQTHLIRTTSPIFIPPTFLNCNMASWTFSFFHQMPNFRESILIQVAFFC